MLCRSVRCPQRIRNERSCAGFSAGDSGHYSVTLARFEFMKWLLVFAILLGAIDAAHPAEESLGTKIKKVFEPEPTPTPSRKHRKHANKASPTPSPTPSA